MIVDALRRWVQSYCNSRAPDFVIGKRENPYMHRWWLIPRNKFFNIYLHKMLRDDDDEALHDHPWWSLSLMLDGYLVEEFTRNPSTQTLPYSKNVETRVIKPGRLVFRNGTFAHRLIVVDTAWTIFVTGPVFRKWGFWCPTEWRFYEDYVRKTDDSSVRGRGCD